MFSRRKFLKTSLAATGLAVGSVILPQVTLASTGAVDWDEEFDVIVVGSGFAGNAAAIEAKKNGANRVLIIEKMEVLGGNSCLNGGQMSIPNTSVQKKKGIKDSVELFVSDMTKSGRGRSHPELCAIIAKEGEGAYRFTLECGVKWSDNLLKVGGHSVARAFVSKNGIGGDIVVPMIEYAKKKGVEFRKRTFVSAIHRDSSRVIGVSVIEDYIFPDIKSGKIRNYKANLAVIMATGGWGADKKFLTIQNPSLAQVETTNQKGATAEGIIAMLEVGAVPVLLDQYQLGPWASIDEYGAQAAAIFCDYAFEGGIMVDKRTGKRFVNELGDRKERADAQLALQDGNGDPYYPVVFCPKEATLNEKGEPNYGFVRALNEGSLKKFDNLEDMATTLDINLKGLSQQVERWNTMVKKGKDDDFGKPLDKPYILKPPYYAIRLWPKIHYCMGGVGITPKGEVIDSRTAAPIPGLYACGETVGGIHGENRLGTTSSTDCIVFGRVAGINAVKRG